MIEEVAQQDIKVDDEYESSIEEDFVESSTELSASEPTPT